MGGVAVAHVYVHVHVYVVLIARQETGCAVFALLLLQLGWRTRAAELLF